MIQLDRNISVLAAIFTAIFIVVSIRASSYILPSKYYFTISSVFKSDESLMLIEHPGLSGPKFCEIADKYNVDERDLEISHYDCEEIYKPIPQSNDGDERYKIDDTQRDRLVEIWFENREELSRSIFNYIVANNIMISARQFFAASEFQDNDSKQFYRYINRTTGRNTHTAVHNEIKGIVNEKFSEYVSQLEDEYNSNFRIGEPVQTSGNTKKENFVASKKIESIIEDLSDKIPYLLFQNTIESKNHTPNLSQIANHVDEINYYWSVNDSIANYYYDIINFKVNKSVDEIFSDNNVETFNLENAVDSVRNEFIIENTPIYLASASIRIFVVFVAVFIASIIFVHIDDVVNFAIGAAMAAFLLTWPVINLWDWVVRTEWQSMKTTFLLIYLIYMIAFFYTGKTAAMVGRYSVDRLCRFVPSIEIAREGKTAVAGVAVSVREILTNLALALSLNAAAYVFNLVVPLNA